VKRRYRLLVTLARDESVEKELEKVERAYAKLKVRML
jgi:formate-dependent phosphoribosylglycinamide formyltransferase (GAR transformylase)